MLLNIFLYLVSFDEEYFFFTDCGGGFITDTRGQLSSPNYPGNYPESAACDWFITGSNGTRIVILISDIDTEAGYDGIIIRDGFSGSDAMLLEYSGSATNLAVLSNGLNVFVGFYSDDSISYRGFNATWQTVSGNVDKDNLLSYF